MSVAGAVRGLAERAVHGAIGPRSFARLARSRGARGLAITYHTIPPETLDAQLDVLTPFFTFVSSAELAACAARRASRDAPLPVALTFDDGKRSNLTGAAGRLERRGVPATFFVTTEPARTGSLHWFDVATRARRALQERGSLDGEPDASLPLKSLRSLAARCGAKDAEVRSLRVLKRTDARERDAILEQLADELHLDVAPRDDDDRSLSPEEVGILARKGFTVGSHSCTHPILTNEPLERVAMETASSRRLLEDWVGAPVTEFAYPNGNASDATERCTRAAGYRLAFTTRPAFFAGSENAHRLPRIELVPEYEAPQIVFKLLVGLLGGLPNPDGTGYAWRRERRA
jgi:peptidoglycan/xylan/chitin deacetylase (PgdA/CDA1 family)